MDWRTAAQSSRRVVGDVSQELKQAIEVFFRTPSSYRVGGVRSRPIHFDVGSLPLTNRDTGRRRSKSRFRHDLYHRLTSCPSRWLLCGKSGDSPVLAVISGTVYDQEAKKNFNEICPRCAEASLCEDWPGNVHELAMSSKKGHRFSDADPKLRSRIYRRELLRP